MPTPRGWALCVAAVALAGLGRALGMRELYVLAAGGPVLVAAGLAYVWTRRVALDVHRRLYPARLPAGGDVRVELRLTNTGRLPLPPLDLADGDRPGLLLEGLAGRTTAATSYRLVAHRRGLVPVGPLRVRLSDPFGVASRAAGAFAPATLTVLPRTEPVAPPPDPPSGATIIGLRKPVAAPLGGEDFHALRPYVDGDDLRLVHWPTSARRDDLLVRQEEAPRIRNTAVLLDLRGSLHDGASLEVAASAAASVATTALDDDGMVRLVTTGGIDTGTAGGEAHLDALMDVLAGVAADRATDLDAAVAALGDDTGATVVVVTTTALVGGDLSAVARLRRLSPLVIAVVLEVAGGHPPPRVPADIVVRVGRQERFGLAWERAVTTVPVDR